MRELGTLEDQKSLVKVFGKRIEVIHQIFNGLSDMRLQLPETGLHPENTGKKVAWIKITSSQGITFERET